MQSEEEMKILLGENLVQLIDTNAVSNNSLNLKEFFTLINSPQFLNPEKIVALMKYLFLLQKQQRMPHDCYRRLILRIQITLLNQPLSPRIKYLTALMVNKTATQADINELIQVLFYPSNTDPSKFLQLLHYLFSELKAINLHSDFLIKLDNKILLYEENWEIYCRMLDDAQLDPELNSPLVEYFYALFWENGYAMTKADTDYSFKLLLDSAKKGCTHAEYYLAQRYKEGRTLDGIRDYSVAFNYLLTAANHGHGDAHFQLYEWYKVGTPPLRSTNMSLAVHHLRLAAENFIPRAQRNLALHQLFGVHHLDSIDGDKEITHHEFKFTKIPTESRDEIFINLKNIANNGDEAALHILQSFTDLSLSSQLPADCKAEIQKMINHHTTDEVKTKLIQFMYSFVSDSNSVHHYSTLEALFYYLLQNYIINIDDDVYREWSFTITNYDKDGKFISLLEHKIELSPLLKIFLADIYANKSFRGNQTNTRFTYGLGLKALKYYEQAAYAGCSRAQLDLYNIYSNLYSYTPQAFFYLDCAAVAGNAEAQFLLSFHHLFEGPVKVVDNKKEYFVTNKAHGMSWLSQAAAQNHPRALYDLARILLKGFEADTTKIIPDPVAAYKLCRKAAELRHTDAIIELEAFHQAVVDFESKSTKQIIRPLKYETAGTANTNNFQNTVLAAEKSLPPISTSSSDEVTVKNPFNEKSSTDAKKSPVEKEMVEINITPATEKDALLPPNAPAGKQASPSFLGRIWQQRTYGSNSPATSVAGANIDSAERKLMHLRKP